MKFAIVKEQHSHGMGATSFRRYEFSILHETLEEAKEEAERLCRKERGAFMVFELKCTCCIGEIPVTWK